MKEKIFILPFLLYPMMVSGLDIYYDTTGTCSTYCNIPYVGTSPTDCCPASNVLTAEAIYEKLSALATARDEVFQGLKIGDTVIMDPAGDLKLDGKGINALNLPTTTTIRTSETNTCQSGSKRNNNQVCINSGTAGQDFAYIDFENGNEEDGYEVDPDQVSNPRGESCMHSKFKLKVHWCPPKHGAYTGNNGTGFGNGSSGWYPPNVPSNFGYPELWPTDCDSGDITEDLDYEWRQRSNASNDCYDGINHTCKGFTDNEGHCRCAVYKKNGVILDELSVPSGKFTDWSLRGFYLRSDDLWTPPANCSSGINQTYNYECFTYWGQRNYFAKRRVVTKTSTEGTARLGLPTYVTDGTGQAVQISTEMGYIPLNDREPYNWANTRWGVWDCSKTDEQVANTTYHLYAGWARDCSIEIPDGSGEPSPSCNLTIKRNGLTQSSNKGDAFYATTCSNGDTPVNNNAYNPTCIGQKVCELQEGMHWCFVGSFPQCVSTDTAYNCCTDNVTGCTKQGGL